MTTKLKNYRINITDDAQPGDALVVWENDGFVTWHMGTSASCDIWTSCWNIPVLDENWKIPSASIPSAVMKKDIYDPNNKNADVFDYCNLDNAPEIPEVFDPVITFTQGGVTKWSISLNQSSPTVIPLDAGWVTPGEAIDIYNSKVSVKYDWTSIWKNNSNQICVVDYDTIKQWATCWASAVQADDLATVAMTGNYCDLINKPEIPSAQIQSDWEQTNINLADYIKNKPTIGNATITLQKNWTNVDTFTLNQTADKCLNIILSKGDVGLANVDNTSDADKPVSDATLCALACKQDNISDLNTIRSNACAGKTASETIANYWNIVTHNVCEFATATQGWKADTAVQPGDLCTVATTGAYSDLTGTPGLCPVATSGSYTDLTDTPVLCNVATSWKYCDLTGTPVLCNVATSWKYCDLSWTPALCTVATTWAYSDLTGTPSLATVATSGKYCDLTGTPNLCTVATSGKYCDLTGTPLLCNIATTAQYSDLLWTPNLCTVATSGKYCDLSGTPTIPTVINTLTSSCTTEALSAKQGCVLNSSITSINWKIPSAATTENQLADKAFVNSSINAVAAYYITKDAQWDQFATKAELDAATVYYSGWVVRTPTRNDYTIVASDETHDNATTRYSYNNGWEYQYTINETPLTQAQLNALNSGITSGKVSSYDSAVTTVNSLCTVATSGKYCDLTGLPTIPTNNNQLANGCGYTTCTGTVVASDLTPYAKTCTLCTVATSWKYCDLTWKPTIPTDNCQLANWCWYITNAALSTYAKCSDIPTNNCQLANGCGYTTCTGTVVASDLTPYAKSCTLCTVATSGKYCDLTGLPTIPTNNNQLTNGCWYTTCTGTLVAWDLAPYAKSADLATVATSGKYCDLSGTPSLATVATTGCYNDLTGKPTIPTKVSQLTNDCNYINKDVNNLSCYTPTSSLATVATSGAYCDLSWKPTLACVACSGSYEDLTCKPNLWVYQTTANMVCTLTNADDSHYPSAKTVADALSCAGAWDMLSSMYDPNGKCADAFDYTNFINTPLLCTVATSGKYCDLTGLPTIPAALTSGCAIGISSNKINVQYDWSTIKKNSWNCLYADFTGLATTASLCSVATSGKYCDLTGAPTIPTNNNQLTNGCGYTTCTWTLVAGDLAPYAKSCTLCTVATSGKYCDLTWQPTIPTNNNQLTNGCWYITDSAINTKTFTLSSASDTTNASAAVAYINWWNDAIILYNWQAYVLSSKTSTQMVFKWQSSTSAWNSSTSISQATLTFTVSWNTVTAISTSATSLWSYLETWRNYTTPFSPTCAWHPATKQYVDNAVAWVTIWAATDSCLWTVKLWSSTVQTVAANTATACSWRTYPVQLNSSCQAVVNVPWQWATYCAWTWIDITTNKVSAHNLFVINEDAFDVTYTWEKWVSPYNTCYCYTNVCINPNCWIQWIEGAQYIFNIDTKVATSACRNVRLKIWNGDYIPLMATSGVAAWSSYFVKASIRPFQYSTKYISTWWLHVVTDSNTTYSAMSVAEWTTWTCTACRTVRADYLKQIIQHYTPTNNCQLANGCWYTTCTWTLSSCSDVIWVLWYTPYNSTNPNGYTTCTWTLVASDLTPYAKSCTLCTVATSGKYCDLTGQPAIPTVGNATITLTQEGNSIWCFTTNSSTATTIDFEYWICYVCCSCASCYSSCCDNRTYLIYE